MLNLKSTPTSDHLSVLVLFSTEISPRYPECRHTWWPVIFKVTFGAVPFLLEVSVLPSNSKSKSFFEYISLKYFTTETKFHTFPIPLSRFHRFGIL